MITIRKSSKKDGDTCVCEPLDQALETLSEESKKGNIIIDVENQKVIHESGISTISDDSEIIVTPPIIGG